jgi:hypothetical protein
MPQHLLKSLTPLPGKASGKLLRLRCLGGPPAPHLRLRSLTRRISLNHLTKAIVSMRPQLIDTISTAEKGS